VQINLAEKGDIGQAINKRRLELGYSLVELGKMTGLTASFIGQIERNKTGVSIDSLRLIADALDLSVFQLLQNEITEEDLEFYVVRANNRAKLIHSKSTFAYEILTPDLTRRLEAHSARLVPEDGNVCRKLRIQTDEFFYVMSGKLILGIGDKEVILEPNDSAYCESFNLNKIACHPDVPETVYICVMTPPAF